MQKHRIFRLNLHTEPPLNDQAKFHDEFPKCVVLTMGTNENPCEAPQGLKDALTSVPKPSYSAVCDGVQHTVSKIQIKSTIFRKK